MKNRSKITTEVLKKSRKYRKALGRKLHESVVDSIYKKASNISSKVIKYSNKKSFDWDLFLDNILTSKFFGFGIMLFLLTGVFYITIKGANVPSAMLAEFLFMIEDKLTVLFQSLNAPYWLEGIVVHGIYRGLAWVVSVMLPPMAIFFPIFTILEDIGYLPRIVFNVDKFFKWAGANGKQALTMAMGFGCNAAGIISTRIINSPRERLIAIITNNFVPCNGRWPTLIVVATIFVGGMFSASLSAIMATLTVAAVTLFGIFITLIVSAFLSKTWLKGEKSSFYLELPPYRKPNILQIIYTSIIDRTLYVLGRAIVVAIPAGAIIWLLGNIYIDNTNLMTISSTFLDPFAKAIGLDGIILLAFIVAIPANEIIMPTIIMGYMSSSQMLELSNLSQLKDLLISNGWTPLTAICLMLFSLLHYPCSTTTWTIWKETKSVKWTMISNVLPTAIAIIVCFFVAQGYYLLF